MAKSYVIHENDAWVEPLRAAFGALDLPYEQWFLSEGRLDLGETPPEGVFDNRMSASSHTRGHRYAPELTACLTRVARAPPAAGDQRPSRARAGIEQRGAVHRARRLRHPHAAHGRGGGA